MTDTPDQPTFNVSAGSNANITIVAPHAHHGSAATAHGAPADTPTPAPHWHRTAVIWSAASAIAAIAGVVVAWLAAK